MRFGIHTLDDFDFRGKTVLCRVDLNQPVDRETGTLKSTARKVAMRLAYVIHKTRAIKTGGCPKILLGQPPVKFLVHLTTIYVSSGPVVLSKRMQDKKLNPRPEIVPLRPQGRYKPH